MRSLALILGLLLVSGPVFAKQGEVCLSKSVSVQASLPLDNDTVFECQSAGSGTVAELYKKGWRVVLAFPQAVMGSMMTMKSSWTLVIEKD